MKFVLHANVDYTYIFWISDFRDLLPEITNVINNSAFICIDGEFTGLSNGDDVTAFDTPTQYYHKLRDGAMSFLFFQFGLAAFQYDPNDKNKWVLFPYLFNKGNEKISLLWFLIFIF